MTNSKDDKTRIQVTLSAALRQYLERQAELRGLPVSTVVSHFLADRMLTETKQHDTTND
jgi:hypothetical protein